jgi:hypothetical protein
VSDTPSTDVLEERIENDKEATRLFREQLTNTLARIEAKQDHTNGRVKKLELWRMFILGGFAALSAPWALKVVQVLSHQ